MQGGRGVAEHLLAVQEQTEINKAWLSRCLPYDMKALSEHQSNDRPTSLFHVLLLQRHSKHELGEQSGWNGSIADDANR